MDFGQGTRTENSVYLISPPPLVTPLIYGMCIKYAQYHNKIKAFSSKYGYLIRGLATQVHPTINTVNSLMFARDLFGEFRDHLQIAK